MKNNKLMKEYLQMSPFEFKNVLINEAKKGKGQMLNAGRGNPNFLNTTVRDAFSIWNSFAVQIANRKTKTEDLGYRPDKKGIALKFKKYLSNKKGKPVSFLKKAINHAEKKLKLNADEFIYEMTDAILGDFYPSPPRIFPNIEEIINNYLIKVLCADRKPKGKFDLFATEGATASMIYIFKSLKENKILQYGDHIAIMTPIFSPYLEIPALNDYKLVQIHIEGDEKIGWQIPDKELKKLEHKKIKAFFMVHPTNPTSVKLNKETVKKIEKIVKTKKKELIILTDTVYATFVNRFNSLLEAVPENTICVYSYSKFYGATGWRLGVIMLHQKNIVDKLISKLSKREKELLDKRYKITSTTPERIKFIERLEMDSRDVALAHTGGLSCPQQVIMTLFTLFYLTDKKLEYKKSIQAILKKRVTLLYQNLEIALPKGSEHAYYYALINVEKMAEQKHGKEFAKYLTTKYCIDEFLLRLAKEKQTVCLPGDGFAGPTWSLRISLANLETEDYASVGRNISLVMDKYFKEWKK